MSKRILRMGKETILLTKVPGEVEYISMGTAVTLAPRLFPIFCAAL